MNIVDFYVSYADEESEETKLSEIAIKLCLTPDAIENEYKKAINKMRKYLTDKLI